MRTSKVAPAPVIVARKLWSDPDFPVCDAAVSGLAPNDGDASDSVAWERPSVWTLDPWLNKAGGMLFSGPGGVPSPARVRQGSLGDCYLVAAMSVLAERPDLAHRLFPAPYDVRTGRVEVALFHNGERRVVQIDDRLPVHRAVDPDTGDVCELMYAHSTDTNELWVPFVEKAYAKIYGSYDALVGGDIAEALRDLTGAPVLELRPTARGGSGAVWDEMVRRHADGEVMACGWCGSEDAAATFRASEVAAATGVKPNHAYAILEVRAVPSRTKGVRRWVRYRDPWGTVRAIAKDAPRPHGAVQCAAGEYWVEWSAFCKAFTTVYVALVGPPPLPGRGGGDGSKSAAARAATTVTTTRSVVATSAWVARDEVRTTTRPGLDEYSAPITTTTTVAVGNDGGCSSFSRWRANPQFAIEVPSGAADRAGLRALVITVSQPDGRALRRRGFRPCGTERSPLGYENKVGVEIVALTDREAQLRAGKGAGASSDTGAATRARAPLLSSSPAPPSRVVVNGEYGVVCKTPYWNKREVSLELPVDVAKAAPAALGARGALVALISCFHPGQTGAFRVTLTATMANESARPPTLVQRCNGGLGARAGAARVGGQWNGEFGALFEELPQFRLLLAPVAPSSAPRRVVVFLRQCEIDAAVPVPPEERARLGLSVLPGVAAAGRPPLPPPISNALEVAVSLTVDAATTVLCIVPTTTVTHRGFSGPPDFVVSAACDGALLSLDAVGSAEKKAASLECDREENAAASVKAAALKKGGKRGKARSGGSARLGLGAMARAGKTSKSIGAMYAAVE
jgi:hypothetical protein